MKKRVADIIFDTLVKHDIKDCFLVVGGGAMHLNNALAKNDRIRKICTHHEQACTMACDSYARLSGKMAVACVTSGPGATNAITGVMGAYQDSIPMVVISGQVRYSISSMATGLPLRYRGIQEFDIINSVKNMTKYAVMVTDPLMCEYEIEKAVDIALSGRRGPVWIDVPLDIQSSIVDISLLKKYDAKVTNYFDIESFKKIFDFLKKSEKPCILCGTGIVSGNVLKEFENFVNKLGIPVISGGWATDSLYTDHPLYYGLSGDIGPRTGNFILQNADYLLVLGNSLSFRQTGYAQDKFAPTAKILWVDADELEKEKPGMRPTVFLHSDLKTFFDQTNYIDISFPKLNKKWIPYCNMLKKRFSAYESIDPPNKVYPSARVNSYYFWKVFDELAPDNTILAMGNSRANAAKIQIGVKKKGQRALTNYLCGSMGFELPAAEGAAVASGKNIICVTGDGSIMMNIQELQTISHNKLPIKVVVFANDGYEAIRQTHKNFFNGEYIGCSPESGISFPDFKTLSKAFGFAYRVCKRNSDVVKNLEWLFQENGNVFLEIKQEIGNTVSPRVLSRMNPDGSFLTPALHDMAPFLPKQEVDDLMFNRAVLLGKVKE